MKDAPLNPPLLGPLTMTERQELEALRQQVAQMTPVWQAHQRKITRQKLTRAIRRLWPEDPAMRARRLIEAHRFGLPATKPDWEELAALLGSHLLGDATPSDIQEPLDGEAMLQQADRFLERLTLEANQPDDSDNTQPLVSTARGKQPLARPEVVLPLSAGMMTGEGGQLPRRVRREMARQAAREAKKQRKRDAFQPGPTERS